MKSFCLRSAPPVSRRARGFTLMEVMIVVAIIGLLAAMGLPSIITAMQKKGMRKALSDLTDVCRSARANAIIHNRTEAVIFHPLTRSFAAESGAAAHSGMVSSSTLPDGVNFAMLDINQQDYGASDPARVFFYPDGTSDELTIVLVDSTDRRKMTIEFATGTPVISDVDR
jgi:type IV fimbrial biogenesis protein FimT